MEARIERASLDAWPAFRSTETDGWIFRLADGYTKRANSVTVFDPAVADARERIDRYEAAFTDERRSPIFRLLSFTDPDPLDHILEERGYERLDDTIVMTRPLDASTADRPDTEPLDSWMTIFDRLDRRSGVDSEVHAKILSAIRTPTCFAVRRADGRPVSCGLAVADEDLVGLFDVVTDVVVRRRGHGEAIVRSLESWGAESGARIAYLQVVAANTPARALYEKLGYRTLYRYHYRVKRVSG